MPSVSYNADKQAPQQAPSPLRSNHAHAHAQTNGRRSHDAAARQLASETSRLLPTKTNGVSSSSSEATGDLQLRVNAAGHPLERSSNANSVTADTASVISEHIDGHEHDDANAWRREAIGARTDTASFWLSLLAHVALCGLGLAALVAQFI